MAPPLVAVSSSVQRSVNWLAAQWRIQRKNEKGKRDVLDEKDVQNAKRDDGACGNDDGDLEKNFGAKLQQMRKDYEKYCDVNLEKLDKKVNDLSSVFEATCKAVDALSRSLDSVATSHCKLGEKVRGDYDSLCELGEKVGGVSDDLDALRSREKAITAEMDAISSDLAELVAFVDDVADRFGIHSDPPPMEPPPLGRRKIKLKR